MNDNEFYQTNLGTMICGLVDQRIKDCLFGVPFQVTLIELIDKRINFLLTAPMTLTSDIAKRVIESDTFSDKIDDIKKDMREVADDIIDSKLDDRFDLMLESKLDDAIDSRDLPDIDDVVNSDELKYKIQESTMTQREISAYVRNMFESNSIRITFS